MAKVTTRAPYNVRSSYTLQNSFSQWSKNVRKDVLILDAKAGKARVPIVNSSKTEQQDDILSNGKSDSECSST